VRASGWGSRWRSAADVFFDRVHRTGGDVDSDLFSANGLAGTAGGSLLAPIFQGGRLSAQEDAARARLEQSIASYRKAVEVALQEVADAAVSVRKLREARVARTDQVKASTGQRSSLWTGTKAAFRATSRCSTPSGGSSTRSSAWRTRLIYKKIRLR